TIQTIGDAYEGGATATVRLTRDDTSGALYVFPGYSGATLIDYTPSTYSPMFADGQATVDFTITANSNSSVTGTQTLTVSVSTTSNYTAGSPSSGAIHLVDDD